MNYKIIKTIAFLFVIVFSSSYAQDEISSKEINPVKSFKEYLTKHFESYKTDKREQLSKLGGGWVKEYYEPDMDYKIDVQKTNSLITPFTAFCEFTLIRHITTFHSSKEEANNSNSFIKSSKRVHKHYYGFQEDKWVVTSRTSQDPELAKVKNPITKRSSFDNWYDCNEVIQYGEQKGATNIHGCWEKEE